MTGFTVNEKWRICNEHMNIAIDIQTLLLAWYDNYAKIKIHVIVIFSGYEGSNCLIDFNECASNPCQNQGICSEPEANMYMCTCQPGYTGTNCEVNIDECQSQPCQVFQLCEDFVNGYR